MLHVCNYSVYNNLRNTIIIIIIIIIISRSISGSRRSRHLFDGIVLVCILSSVLDSTWYKVSIKHKK